MTRLPTWKPLTSAPTSSTTPQNSWPSVTGGAISAFVGLRLELPTDATQLDNAAARARLAVDSATERLREAREGVEAAALEGLEALRTAEARLTFALETARLAGESAVGQKARFEAGAGTATELVVAEQQRLQDLLDTTTETEQ